MIVRPVRAVLSALISSCKLCLWLKVARHKEGASWVPSVLRHPHRHRKKESPSKAIVSVESVHWRIWRKRYLSLSHRWGVTGLGVGSSQKLGEPLGSGASEPHFCHLHNGHEED